LAYAIISNHLLHVSNQVEVSELTDLEVIKRWHKFNKGAYVIQRYLKGEKLSKEGAVNLTQGRDSSDQ
jgi:hypothetical protein